MRSPPGCRRSLRHRVVLAAVGDLMLSCGKTSTIQGAIGDTSGVGWINFCAIGSSTDLVAWGAAAQLGPAAAPQA